MAQGVNVKPVFTLVQELPFVLRPAIADISNKGSPQPPGISCNQSPKWATDEGEIAIKLRNPLSGLILIVPTLLWFAAQIAMATMLPNAGNAAMVWPVVIWSV